VEAELANPPEALGVVREITADRFVVRGAPRQRATRAAHSGGGLQKEVSGVNRKGWEFG